MLGLGGRWFVGREGRSVAKSFRINEKALIGLEEEADRQRVSVNTLVNQLLISYSEFGQYLSRIGALELSRKTFQEILDAVSEEDIIRAGQTAGKSAPNAYISSKWGRVTLNTVIEFIHDLSTYANLYEYSEKNENEHWTITLTHELGPKWSTFLAQYLAQALISGGVQPKTKVSGRAVIFNF
jgi:hypothetical protein